MDLMYGDLKRQWEADKAWSDKFIPEIRQHIAPLFITVGGLEDDMKRCTDLYVMEGGGKRVGCRVRRNKYLENYGREFTIRSNRNSGAETELSKILDGWGDYFYYGFSDPYNEHIAQWFVGDLGVFRGYVHQNGWVSKNNTDQETSFAYFNVDKLPDNFVLLASWK